MATAPSEFAQYCCDLLASVNYYCAPDDAMESPALMALGRGLRCRRR
jgi:hypothetical protein